MQKKIIFTIFLVLFYLAPFFNEAKAFPLSVCIRASGFTNEDYNGLYTQLTYTIGNETAWVNTNGIMIMAGGSDMWFMDTSESVEGDEPAITETNTHIIPPVSEVWNFLDDLGNPIGTTVDEECVGSIPGVESPFISLNNKPHVYFYGFALFSIGFVLAKKI